MNARVGLSAMPANAVSDDHGDLPVVGAGIESANETKRGLNTRRKHVGASRSGFNAVGGSRQIPCLVKNTVGTFYPGSA